MLRWSVAFWGLVLVQVLGVATGNSIVVPIAEKENYKSMAKGPHIVQSFAIASKPGEGLFSNGSVQAMNALLQSSLGTGSARAILGVTIGMKPVQAKVLELLQSLGFLCRRHVVTSSVQAEEIDFGGQDLQLLDVVTTSFASGSSDKSYHSTGTRIDQHKPPMLMYCRAFFRILGVAMPCDTHHDKEISCEVSHYKVLKDHVL